MKKRKINIIVNKDGHGTIGYKISLPTSWIQQMGFNQDDRLGSIEYRNNQIIIRKEDKKMRELKEKLLKHLGLGQEVEYYEGIDYLSENKGLDGQTYYWYMDNELNACINIETAEIIEDEQEIDKIFGIDN